MELVHARDRVLAPAVLAGNAGIALERADEAGKAQLGLAGRRRRDELLDLLLDRLVVHLVGFNGGLRVLLGLLGLGGAELGFLDGRVQLALLRQHLAVLGVEIGLFALQLGPLAFQLGLIVFEGRLRVPHGGQNLSVLHRDVLHDLVEGQQLVQVGHGSQHGHAAAVPQLLHGGHVLFETIPLVGNFCLLLGDLLFLGRDLLFLHADAVLHLGDLAFQHADLALDDGHFLFQVGFQLLCRRLFFLGVGKLLLMLLDGLGELVQLVLQRGHTRRG